MLSNKIIDARIQQPEKKLAYTQRKAGTEKFGPCYTIPVKKECLPQSTLKRKSRKSETSKKILLWISSGFDEPSRLEKR